MSEEIKYEAVFGNQCLFDGAGTFSGLDVVVHSIANGLKSYARSSDLTPESLRNNPVCAMRRIIRTPTWTTADQKAGKLPEVLSKFTARGFTWECVRIINNTVLAVSGDSYCGFEFNECKPIESPEEKAARLREEWCESALKIINHKFIDARGPMAIYDALLSGDLPVPVKGE